VLLLSWRLGNGAFRFFPAVLGSMNQDQRSNLVTTHLKKHETKLSLFWCLGSKHSAQKIIAADGLDAAFRKLFSDYAKDIDPAFD
jgi:hypothetical protein